MNTKFALLSVVSVVIVVFANVEDIMMVMWSCVQSKPWQCVLPEVANKKQQQSIRIKASKEKSMKSIGFYIQNVSSLEVWSLF